jgi:hypothetical protein
VLILVIAVLVPIVLVSFSCRVILIVKASRRCNVVLHDHAMHVMCNSKPHTRSAVVLVFVRSWELGAHVASTVTVVSTVVIVVLLMAFVALRVYNGSAL